MLRRTGEFDLEHANMDEFVGTALGQTAHNKTLLVLPEPQLLPLVPCPDVAAGNSKAPSYWYPDVAAGNSKAPATPAPGYVPRKNRKND